MAKWRLSFVTNSSSSSFICEICGEEHSGWDLSPRDVGGDTCANGHEFCGCFNDFEVDDEAIKAELIKEINRKINKYRTEEYWVKYRGEEYAKESEQDLKEIESGDADIDALTDKYFDGECLPCNCPICSLQAYSQVEMVRYLEKTRGISTGEVFAIVKEQNKRRRKLYDSEYIKFVFDKFGLTDESIMEEIRGKFKSWEEFVEFI